MVVTKNITDSHTNSHDVAADIRAVYALANAVPDPELIVVTVGDLGIIRNVLAEEGHFVIDVTPTYSGCPAALAIELSIEMAVRSAGFDVRVRRVLAPAWTSDWISDDGRTKLQASGIAPPQQAAQAPENATDYFTDARIPCPRCASQTTSRLSQFGSTACKAQYQCDDCHEPFDYFKCI